jgi:diguanylate cyclase (GGDEF)-like protein/PAS domain S-box-containing protein
MLPEINFNLRWMKVTFPLLATAIMLVALGAFSMDILSSVRAYVEGEGLYSKAQKDAVLHIKNYVKSPEEHHYQRFLQAIAVPLGDRQARLALDRATPDVHAARLGFLAGRNHDEDIAGMIRLFSNFRHVSFMNEVIAIWSAADVLVDELTQEAERLHRQIVSGQNDEASLQASLARIEAISVRLDPLEAAFSARLGDASRQISSMLLLAMLVIGCLLMGGGSLILRRILKKNEKFQDALRISEERLYLAMRGTSDGLWDWDIVEKSTYYSPKLKELLEENSERISYPVNHFFQYVDPRDLDMLRMKMKQYLREHASYDVEFRIITPSGKLLWVRSRAQCALDASGKPIRMAGSITDITGRKEAALELMRSNRALQMLSRCNDAVIRTENEAQLLHRICAITVDIGSYRMAWVGYAQDDEACSILLAAQAGDSDDLARLAAFSFSWLEQSLEGQGPSGRTIRSGAPVWFDDVEQASNAVVKLPGCSGGVCLPLRDKDRTFGLLALYSSHALPVSVDETRLLQELADGLAFGIVSIRARDEQRRVLSAVMKIAAGVSASTGTAFFQQLALNMADALGADAGFVVRLLPGPGGMMQGRSIAAVQGGHVIDNIEYPLAAAPCASLLSDQHVIIARKVASLFPAAPFLKGREMQAYVGRRLDNAAGQPVGLLFVLFADTLKNAGFITSTLQIFAARVAAEMARLETDARIHDQAALLDKARDAIIVRGMNQHILYWNKSAERLYGWTQAEAQGCSIATLLADDASDFDAAVDELLDLGVWSGEIVRRRKDGSTLSVESRWTLVRSDDGLPQSILAIDTDITERKAAEQKILQLAFYDPLTLLPNRRLLLDRLQQALLSHARNQSLGALLFIDLDNFKILNDTLGHDHGDLLLQQAAARLLACVRASDTVARLGGDEFVVLLDFNQGGLAEAARGAAIVGEHILAALSEPYQIDGNEHHSSSSIGITLFDQVQQNVGEVLKRADLAMYQAKSGGRNTMRFFDPEMLAAVSARAALEADLRQALPREQLELYYQPQVDGDGKMTGVEALLRWQHPRLGFVPPDNFIALAEESGLILPIGLWVLRTACAQLALWAGRAATAHLDIAVNVSVRQFRHADFVSQIMDVLACSGADPRHLKLELTESLMVDDMEVTIAKMAALKAQGVSFSLDDFGTGYSSLAYLKRLPLDQLKIDQSFVRDVLTDPNDAAIARTIVALAQSLGLTVIAEGVETEAQRSFLARHGCHACQGYLYSRPLPIEQLELFVQANAEHR